MLETTAGLECYFVQQREIVLYETRRRRGCLPYLLLASFEFCPILLAKNKSFGKGLSPLGVPLMSNYLVLQPRVSLRKVGWLPFLHPLQHWVRQSWNTRITDRKAILFSEGSKTWLSRHIALPKWGTGERNQQVMEGLPHMFSFPRTWKLRPVICEGGHWRRRAGSAPTNNGWAEHSSVAQCRRAGGVSAVALSGDRAPRGSPAGLPTLCLIPTGCWPTLS